MSSEQCTKGLVDLRQSRWVGQVVNRFFQEGSPGVNYGTEQAEKPKPVQITPEEAKTTPIPRTTREVHIKPSSVAKSEAAPTSAHEDPSGQLPPLPIMDMLSFTQLNDPRYYVPYTVGLVICILGVVRIAQKGLQLVRGTMPLPPGHVRRADGEVVRVGPNEGDQGGVGKEGGGRKSPSSAKKRRGKRAK